MRCANLDAPVTAITPSLQAGEKGAQTGRCSGAPPRILAVPLSDLFHALPFVLLLGVVPGIALTTLIAPRLSWAERLAAAPGFSVACVGVSGLVLHLLHLPFYPPTVIPILVVLVGAAIVRQVASSRQEKPVDGAGWLVVAVALAAGAVLAGITAAAMSGDVLPPANDPSLHGAVAATIVQDRDVLPVVPVPADGSGFVRTQAAFEATDALASEIGAGGPAQVMVPLALVSLLALPLGLAVLAYHVTQDRRVAAVAAALSLGLIFPVWPAGYGDYPYLVDSTLVVPLILAVTRCLEGKAVVSSAVMAGAAVLAMWSIHGLELPTAIAVGAFLWLSILVTRRRAALGGAAVAFTAVVIAVGAGYVLTRAPSLPPAHLSSQSVPNEAVAYVAGQRNAGLGALTPFVNLDLSIIGGILLCAGAVTVVVTRRWRWLLGSLAIPLLCVADVAGPQWPHPLWVRLYPWTDLDRLYGLEYFVIPVIAAIGTVALVDMLSRRAAQGGPERSRRMPVWSAAAIGVLAAGGLVLGASRSSDMLSAILAMSPHVPAQDAAVIDQLAAKLPPGSLVLNDGVEDSGQWITALTDDVEVEPRGYAETFPDDWRLVALSGACSDPSSARAALIGVRAVFVGSAGGATGPHHWNAACIAAIPGLRLVAGSTSGAAGFLVG